MSKPKYRYRHQQIRAALLPQAYGTPCHLCGRLMLQGQRLALDHTADGTGYRGIAHLSCNAREGAVRGALLRRLRRGSAIFPRSEGR